MEETQNPYAPPKADISTAPNKLGPGTRRVYSPKQGSLGAFLGGPLAGTYFVCMNFVALGKVKQARLATVLGAGIAAGAILWHFFFRDVVLGGSIRIAYPIIVWFAIARAQLTKAQTGDSSMLAFHSNWRVAGVTLLGFVSFAALGVAAGRFLLHP